MQNSKISLFLATPGFTRLLQTVSQYFLNIMNHLDVYCICLINSAYHVTNFTTVRVFYGRTKKVNQISVASGHINGSLKN